MRFCSLLLFLQRFFSFLLFVQKNENSFQNQIIKREKKLRSSMKDFHSFCKKEKKVNQRNETKLKRKIHNLLDVFCILPACSNNLFRMSFSIAEQFAATPTTKDKKKNKKQIILHIWMSVVFVCANIWIFTIFRTKLITCKLGIILMQGNSLPFFQRIGSILSKYRHKKNECFSCISNCNEKVTFSKTLCSRSQFCNKFLHGFFPSLLNFHCFSCSNFRRNKQSKNTIYKKEKKNLNKNNR